MSSESDFNRSLIEVFTIKPEVKKLTKKELLALLDKMFKEQYQGKSVSFEMLEKELFVKTTSKTRKHFGFKSKSTSRKGHLTKLRIGANGDYLKLISNLSYLRSFEEKKPDQNAMHQDTEAWHYFMKYIICEDAYFKVKVDVNESKKKEFIIYSVSLESTTYRDFAKSLCEKTNKRDTIHSAPQLTDFRDGTSCDNIISDVVGDVNRKSEKYSEKSSLDEAMNAASQLVTKPSEVKTEKEPKMR